MVNPLLLLSGIGMMLVAIIAIVYWKGKTRTAMKYFLYGALVWIITIIAKLLLDLTVSASVYDIFSSYSMPAAIALTGLYVGLRTGLFESGFSYIAVLKTKLKKMNFNEAIAFGIGFGAFEALILGALSFISVLQLILDPSLEIYLSPSQLQQLSMSGWIIAASVIERVSTIFIHIFASILVIYSVRSGKLNFLVISILYKTLADGMIPFLTSYIDFTEIGILLIELPIIIVGLAGFLGIGWIKKKFTKVGAKTVRKLPRRKRR